MIIIHYYSYVFIPIIMFYYPQKEVKRKCKSVPELLVRLIF